MKLNIGCGNLPLPEFKNIDKSYLAKADEVYDITIDGIKEKTDSIDEIHAGCMLEQVGSNYDFIYVLNECWRVLKDGGFLWGYVPSTDPRVMFLDPMDKRFFQEGTFDYMVKTKHHWQEFGKNYGFQGWSDCETSINESGILHFKLTK